MRRFLLDTGIAAFHFDRKRGVFERAAVEVARGNRVGIAATGKSAAKATPSCDRRRSALRQGGSTCGNSGSWTLKAEWARNTARFSASRNRSLQAHFAAAAHPSFWLY